MNTQKHHQTVSIEFLNIALYCWNFFLFTHKVQKLIVPKCTCLQTLLIEAQNENILGRYIISCVLNCHDSCLIVIVYLS